MGTLLGVLFAPKKGKDLRESVAKEIKDGGLGVKSIGDNIQAMGRDIGTAAQEVYDQPQVKNNVERGTKNIKKSIKKAWDGVVKKVGGSRVIGSRAKTAKSRK